MADLSEIRDRLAAHHEAEQSPQRAALAQRALSAVEDGLRELEALGHRFSLGSGEFQAVIIFPKHMYKDGMPTLEVNSSDELKAAVKDGWREHPTEEGPVGPRPNGHPELQVRAPAPDPVMSHPMSQSLAAGQGEPPAGPGFGYLTGDDDAEPPAEGRSPGRPRSR